MGKAGLDKIIDGAKAVTNAVGGVKTVLAGAALGTAALAAATGGTGRSSINNGDLSFPKDIPDYHITFQFEAYQRPDITQRAALVVQSGIRLPIPNNLVDQQTVTYSTEALGVGGGEALAAFDSVRKGGSTLSAAENAAQGIALNAAQNIQSTVAKAFTQTFGKATNPFLTVFFEAPAFKEHTFSWKLAPTSVQESLELQKIIKRFKKSMLPGMSGSSGGTLLSYPDVVDIQLFPNDSYLYQFKKCVIKSMSVNYAPGNTPSFFNSTAPTEVQLTVNLQEIEYWLQEDIV